MSGRPHCENCILIRPADTFYIVDTEPALEGVDVATNATTVATAFTRYTVAPTTAFSQSTKITGYVPPQNLESENHNLFLSECSDSSAVRPTNRSTRHLESVRPDVKGRWTSMITWSPVLVVWSPAWMKRVVSTFLMLLDCLDLFEIHGLTDIADALALFRQLILASPEHRQLASDLQATVTNLRLALSVSIEEAWRDRDLILEGVVASGGMGLGGDPSKSLEAVMPIMTEWKGLGVLARQ